MLRSMRGLIFAVIAFFCTGVYAQIINAASCSQSDVQTALNSVTATTTTVNIPAGTCTWTATLNSGSWCEIC